MSLQFVSVEGPFSGKFLAFLQVLSAEALTAFVLDPVLGDFHIAGSTGRSRQCLPPGVRSRWQVFLPPVKIISPSGKFMPILKGSSFLSLDSIRCEANPQCAPHSLDAPHPTLSPWVD